MILLLCHWIACLWWALGTSDSNLLASFGTSWIFRHSTCNRLHYRSWPLGLPSTYESAAEQALLALVNTTRPGIFTERHLEVLRHNWKYLWCDATDDPAVEFVLHHDFGLYLGHVTGLDDGLDWSTDFDLLAQQYLSAMYWSLTALMKTAYVGPDTSLEKSVACVLVLLGAFVFAVIMGMVVQVIKSVEAKGAALRGACCAARASERAEPARRRRP